MPRAAKALTEKQASILDRHFAAHPPGGELTRVWQWEGASSVYNPKTGRLHVHKHDRRKSAKQEFVFESARSVCSTVVSQAAHTVKLWDLRRQLTPRELARLQGFPENFALPRTRYHSLFGNAVAVPMAAYGCAAVLGADADGPVRFLDVCAGIGGFHLGMMRAAPAAVCVGFCEIKGAAVECYSSNFPSAPALGDARTTAWPDADVLCAGFPCQPFSRAQQKMEPIAHPSFDFFRYVLRGIDESKARGVVLENVTALLSTGKDVFDTLRSELRERGFRVLHQVLDARDFGLPQRRRRVIVVARRGAGSEDLTFAPVPPCATPSVIGDVLEDS